MFRQFQLDNTASPSNERADSFTELVAAHHDVVDTVDAFGAFGAFDAYFDEDTEVRLFEILFDAGSHPSDTIDESTDNDATNNDNTKGSHDTSCGSTSHTLAQNTLPTAHPFNTPVESCYWANLNLASSPCDSSSQTAAEESDGRSSPSNSVAEPLPFLIRSDLALGELQVTEDPFFALPLSSTEDPKVGIDEIEEKNIVPNEWIHRSPLIVSTSSESTHAASPLPITPLVGPCEAIGTVPRHTEAVRSSAQAPTLPNGPADADSPRGKRSLSERASDDASLETEEGPKEAYSAADADVASSDLTPATSRLSQESLAVASKEAASTPKRQLADLEVAPEVPLPSSSQSADAQEPRTFPVSQDTAPPNKRKRVTKTHAMHELRELSTLPPERKEFSLQIREGRASKSGISRIQNMQLEAESCCHLAGNNGFCRFRDLVDGERKCMVELPKDGKVTRAHLAMHIDALGWREYSQLHPDWKPTCPWCNERPTKLEQLVRHILDTHLLMFMEWCPCGGTNSRSNTSTNRVRHVDSDVHKDYLRQQAGLVVVKDEEVDDGQEEFVQGSSKGTKRRRRR
ncbi:hypothetical protein ACEPAI_6632 [Sanghuangporus weigelae]